MLAPLPMTDAAALRAPAEGTVRPRPGWRPAPRHRLRDAPGWERWVAIGVLVVLVALPLLSAAIVLQQGWRPSGDNALIGLRVRDVLDGRFPLVGQPSTGENFGSGVESSHPGPIEFYVIAPFVLLLGPVVGLALGAGAINAAALASVGWLAFRRGGLPLQLIAAFVVVLLARSLGGNFLHDPVSSNVGALMALALMFASWSIIAGDLRVAPLFVAVGTFALQDHLSFLGTGAPLVLVALGLGAWWARRIAQRTSGAAWLRPRLLLAGAIGVVLWLPVVIDQLWRSGNVGAIVRTFTSEGGESSGAGFGFERLAEALAPWPIFARRVAPLGWLHTPSTHELVGGYLVFLAVIVLGVLHARHRRTDLATMALVVVIAALTGLYTAIGLPDGAGVKAANLRWMWTVSAFAWIALAWLVWNLLPALAREIVGLPAVVIGGAGMVVGIVAVVVSIGLPTDRDGTIAEGTDALAARVSDELPEGRYRVTFAGGAVVLSIGPALVHDLEHDGDELFVDIGPFTRAYGDHRAFDGQEVDGTIVISAEAADAYPEGTRLLGRETFQVNRNDDETQTIRVFLTEDAP